MAIDWGDHILVGSHGRTMVWSHPCEDLAPGSIVVSAPLFALLSPALQRYQVRFATFLGLVLEDIDDVS